MNFSCLMCAICSILILAYGLVKTYLSTRTKTALFAIEFTMASVEDTLALSSADSGLVIAAPITNFSFPKHFPLDKSLKPKFDKVLASQSSDYTHIVTIKNRIIQTTKNYIEFILDEDDESELYIDDSMLNNNLTAFKQLLYEEYKLNTLFDSTSESKSRIHNKTKNDPPLTLDTLQEYQLADRTVDDETGITESIKRDYLANLEMHSSQKSFESFLNNSEGYTYLKNVSFILLHPEDPLADSNEDDEISIAGGKISLKDPISLQFFENPVISKMCSHVFEESSIKSMANAVGSSRQFECPMDGCKVLLKLTDLVPEELMKLRVRVFKASQRR